MERIDEVYGKNRYLDFINRGLDPLLCRFLTRDADEKKYPGYSTYSAFLNNPIYVVDPTGKGGKSSLVEINGVKTILVTTSLVVFTNNRQIQSNINNYVAPIEQEIESNYNGAGATSSWGGSGNYPVVFDVNVQVYQKGQKIEHRPDVNYVELVDNPNGQGGQAYPDNIQFNVGGSRTEGNYAHEFGHILGFGRMFANNKDKFNDGVTFYDHSDIATYNSNGMANGIRIDNAIRNTRMKMGIGINQSVVDRLNFGTGVGKPLEMNLPNNKISDIGGKQYGQFMIQSGVQQNSKGSSFYFGQQNKPNNNNITNSCSNECEE